MPLKHDEARAAVARLEGSTPVHTDPVAPQPVVAAAPFTPTLFARLVDAVVERAWLLVPLLLGALAIFAGVLATSPSL